MNTIRRNGLRVPDDISVAGYDGISLAQALEPKLTTIRQDTDRIGSEAAKQLINLVENPMVTSITSFYLNAQLMKGDSVGKVKKNSQKELRIQSI
jgi:LacI family transcriptional regulator